MLAHDILGWETCNAENVPEHDFFFFFFNVCVGGGLASLMQLYEPVVQTQIITSKKNKIHLQNDC